MTIKKDAMNGGGEQIHFLAQMNNNSTTKNIIISPKKQGNGCDYNGDNFELMNKDKNQNNKKSIYRTVSDKVPARMVLYFLSWSGFLVSFMMRNDINFALVVMVRDNQSDILNEPTSCYDLPNSLNNNLSIIINSTNIFNKSLSDFNNNKRILGDTGEYDWSSTVKAAILSSFYWCYVLSQVVGGIATQYFGTKKVFGWSQFATACCSLCIPYASDLHYGFVILLRSIQGFASGLTWPAMYAIVAYWIPAVERSRFMSSFQGFSIGIGLTYPLCGVIIEHFGWRYVFYTTGTIGLLWCVMWYFLAFNLPSEHPRITAEELEYIESNVDEAIKSGKGMKVPWKSIFTSLPAWSIGVTTFGRIWIHYQFIMGGPTYMKKILGFSIQSNGLLSGSPFLCSYISSVVFCYIADYLVKRELMTLTNVRKLMTIISQIIPGILILAIGFTTDNIVLVLVVWFIAVTLITASYAGAMASIVDIAPNLAGPVLAFAQTIHMTASFVSPFVTGFVVTNEQCIYQWQEVFGLSCLIAFCTYIMFQIYGTADIQSWNYPKTSTISSSTSSSEDSQMLYPQQKRISLSNGQRV